MNTEIDILRKSLCLSRQRAEDAESDLAEARRECEALQARLALLRPVGPNAAPVEDPEVTRIARELLRVMAKNDRKGKKEGQGARGEG
jgi:hypothetical protein